LCFENTDIFISSFDLNYYFVFNQKVGKKLPNNLVVITNFNRLFKFYPLTSLL